MWDTYIAVVTILEGFFVFCVLNFNCFGGDERTDEISSFDAVRMLCCLAGGVELCAGAVCVSGWE